MQLGIYKSDQGYWTRTISAICIGVIGLSGSAWLWEQLSRTGNIYVQGVGAAVFFMVFAAAVYWFYGANNKSVDFFIATEGEMKKVNWTTRREIIGSTWVVIVMAICITLVLAFVDIIFKEIFTALGVLVGDSEVLGIIKKIIGFLSGSPDGG